MSQGDSKARTEEATPAEQAGEEIAPVPGDLVESLRDFGYTLPSALADLIDNSLAAEAKAVDVYLEANGPDSY